MYKFVLGILMLSAPLAQPGRAEDHDFGKAALSAATLYVAPDGDDANDGSFNHPFASLGKAAAAVKENIPITVLVQGGRYKLADTVVIDAPKTSVAFIAYPGQHPVIDGGGEIKDALLLIRAATKVTVAGIGFTNTAPDGVALRLEMSGGNTIVANDFNQVGTAVILHGSSANIISGNLVTDVARNGIEVIDDSDDNQIDSNLIDGVGVANTQGGGIMVHGASGNRITHNLVRNTAGMGIGVENWDIQTVNVGTIIAYNIIRDVNLKSDDSGAIYMLGRSQVDTGTIIVGNLVDGSGPSTSHNVGIYLDDSTSGTLVTGNIVRRPGSDALQIHGGSRNTVSNNIFDLGADHASAILFQAAPMDTSPSNEQVQNVVSRNIIYSSSTEPKIFFWIDGGHPDIVANLYYNAAGADMATKSPVEDASPRFGDPGFANADAGDYAILPGSQSSTIGFAAIDQGNMGLRPLTAYAYPCWETLASGCPRPAAQ